MSRTPIHTDRAPAAIGQIPLDPASGELVSGIDAQIIQVFDNLKAVAEAGGADLGNTLKVTVFLTDLAHFARVNEVMEQYFTQPFPARAAIEVAGLPKGAEVEADAVVAV